MFFTRILRAQRVQIIDKIQYLKSHLFYKSRGCFSDSKHSTNSPLFPSRLLRSKPMTNLKKNSLPSKVNQQLRNQRFRQPEAKGKERRKTILIVMMTSLRKMRNLRLKLRKLLLRKLLQRKRRVKLRTMMRWMSITRRMNPSTSECTVLRGRDENTFLLPSPDD